MAHKLYQKLISAMADEGVCNASDVDMSASVNGQPYSKVGAIIDAIISFINGLSTTLSNLVSTGLKREIVQSLPTGNNISETTIYLMLKSPAGASGDIYDEYMYINNNWEHIGSTEVDLSDYVQKPSNTSDNKQYVMRNGQWVEVQIATDAASITYSGNVTGAANVKAAIDALALDATLAQQLAAAISNEVGDIATDYIAAGTIVFHNGQFYKTKYNIAEGDRWGIDIDATQTTLSDVIYSLESNKVSYPAGGNSNTQYVMRNGQWVEEDAANIPYSGDMPNVLDVEAAIDALHTANTQRATQISSIETTLAGLRYPLRLVGAISNSANSTLISEINSEAIGGTGSNFPNIEVGQAYYYAKDETSTINGHNIPTGSGVIAQGDVIICLVKSSSDVENATGYHTEWLAVNGNITQAQLSALIENQLEGVVDAYNYWVDNIKPAGTAATLENYILWLREPSVTAAQSALDAVAELTDLSGQWIELTKAQYTACDNNTDKTAIPWTAIDNTLPYLHENFKYIITDQSEEAALTAIINSLFVKCTRSEYEALVSAGTVNPNAYYLIAEETSNN